MVLVLMGVSGTGKTTLGTMLAQATGWQFLDGDDFHPAANKAKMAAGQPLTDEDRAPWLATLHGKIAEFVQGGRSMVMACSALKAQYRAVLQGDLPSGSVQFALLQAPEAVIADRLAHRHHAYMNPNLLGSQLATLEHPGDTAWQVSVAGTPQQSLQQLEGDLRQAGAWPQNA